MAAELDDLAEDTGAFAALDAYLAALHMGLQPDRARLFADHPRLRSAMECLDSLDLLAIPFRGGSVPGKATLPPGVDVSPTRKRGSALGGVSGSAGIAFGKYELLEELGRGGMGVVYKARQTDLDRLVAIKMILASHLASADQIQRFQAEAKAAARLRHANIVQIHEAGSLHGQQYFAMEYIEGPSLADALQSGRLDPQDGARILAAVARAVDYLHSQGILHRDLKPANVLLEIGGLVSGGLVSGKNVQATSRPADQPTSPPDTRLPDHLTPRLTDFGLAKMVGSTSDMTRSGAIIGTPSYMAPEQAAGKHDEVGPLSDVFSLGAILYQMLTGRPPFRAETPLDTLVQVIEREPAPPRELCPTAPRELELVCLKCLEKAPERRYASAGALADDLERYLQGEDIEARPQNAVQRIWRWSRSAPTLAAHLGALALFAVIVHAVWLAVHHVTVGLHLSVLGLLAAWAGASYIFQRGLRVERWANASRHAWAATDALLLTAVLGLTDNAVNPLVVFYALLIVGSGLWFRVPLVWFTTLAAELGYALLMAWAAYDDAEIPYPHHQLIFMLSLAVLGYMVAYQVKRVRALSRYYENRPLA